MYEPDQFTTTRGCIKIKQHIYHAFISTLYMHTIHIKIYTQIYECAHKSSLKGQIYRIAHRTIFNHQPLDKDRIKLKPFQINKR
jgi:hypothetical protein